MGEFEEGVEGGLAGEGAEDDPAAAVCKTLTHLQTAQLLSRKVSYDTPVPRAHKRDRQLPRAATAWEKRRLSAPGASRASQHLPKKCIRL